MADLAPPLTLDPEAILSIPNRLALAKHFSDRAIVDTVVVKSQGEDAGIFDQLKMGSAWLHHWVFSHTTASELSHAHKY